ncbi:MAG: DUF4082 domain-containing protein [Candidatus Eremiobacteraeota bacterium]|nr:DUF4082 domain-containing protein [Candidatus Eremiobacteraeota bacterium]
MKTCCLLFRVLTFALLAASSAIAVPVLTLPETNGNTQAIANTTAGWSFTVNQTIQVTALGLFDDASVTGLTDSHQIGIWDSSSALIASATVPSGTAATLVSNFRYVSIAPVTLLAGQVYTIGASFLANSFDYSNIFRTSAVFNPVITYGEARTVLGSGLNNPVDSGFGLEQGVFGPNFDFILAGGAPELDTVSATLPLAFASMLLLSLKRRRFRSL